jgi:NADPH:quinone reductase-like Zn-dependent oxidoreductase
MSGSSSGGVSASGVGQVGSAIGGVVSDIGAYVGAGYTEAGEEAAAQGFGEAAQIAYQNSQEAEAAGKLQQVQTARQVFKTEGAGIATAAGNGLKLEGSAASILRGSAAQGALAGQLIGTQTQINVNGYISQMQSDQAEQQQAEDAAAAAKASKTGDLISGVISGVTAVAEVAAMA